MNSVKILRNDETSSVAKVFGPCHSRAHLTTKRLMSITALKTLNLFFNLKTVFLNIRTIQYGS